MKCEECCYYWQEENESRPFCHFEPHCAGDLAPCEYEDYVISHYADDEPEDYVDDEMGFDPYEGCYTWDC